MPAVFVHGIPDTSAIWDALRARLARKDTVALRLPGFGEPVPAGFLCTKDEYAGWVTDRVRDLGEPVDLVGHDWGSLIAQRIVTTEPELIRTFTLSDGAVSGRFEWHDLARQWQTPEVGEQIMELMTPDTVEATLREAGHPDAATCGARADDTMKDSILRLYRSAIDMRSEWDTAERGRERPGLVLWGRDDTYGLPAGGEAAARAAGARFVVLDGGHWAIFERIDEAARELEAHWAAAG
jgi:pimeloyl-ACP methyl ester carboxylesterase